jgi:cell division septum initiation protein DivIVA
MSDSELRQRIDELEGELERYRKQERLVVDTVLSATVHATVIRESARRDAQLTLRKARAEAVKRTSTVEQERDQAIAELLRLRRITEQMRSGLSAFLSATVEELRGEGVEEAHVSEENAELEVALASLVNRRSSAAAGSGAAPTSDPWPRAQHRGEHDPNEPS